MQIDILEVMKDICGAMGVQIIFLAPPYDNINKIAYGIQDRLYEDFDYIPMIRELEEGCRPNTIYILKDAFSMYHTIFRVPEWMKEENGFTHCVMGPILFEEYDKLDFGAIMKKMKIDDKYRRDLKVFYSGLPHVDSFEHWSNIVISFCRRIFPEDVTVITIEEGINSFFTENISNLVMQMEPKMDVQTIEDRYTAENDMLMAVKQGDSTEALVRYNQFKKFRILPRTSDNLRNIKNLQFVLNTLLRKTVEQMDVHPCYIDEVSTRFAIQIENCTREAQVNKLGAEMVRKYSLLVKNYARSGYSNLVHRCLDYVEFHYMEHFSLNDLAKEFSVNSTHLSSVFKKETKINLVQYVQTVRLRRAITLLNSTRLSIQEIADQCGFQDVNYFTRVFKKKYGVSPREYRNKVQQQ